MSREDHSKVRPLWTWIMVKYTPLPACLVVMQRCQLSRTQIWLENLLKPLSKMYGSFEFIKDSTDYLIHLENLKTVAQDESWDWDNFILFNIDVKALYPSVKFSVLTKALHHAFDTCTDWNEHSKDLLVEIIIYTLENQQLMWDGKYYLLKQGIATGAKHAVPLANILMSFIIKDLLLNNQTVKLIFDSNVYLWRRFIDDGTGIFKGTIEDFGNFHRLLQEGFKRYDLEITCDTDTHTVSEEGFIKKNIDFITFLDVEVFKRGGTIHTREHRKETATTSYLSIQSAHPRHTFAGIVKSQLYRIRRICSSNEDFVNAVGNLETRCLNSGYSPVMVQSILSVAPTLERNLSIDNNGRLTEPTAIFCNIRLVTLAGTVYENDFSKFASRMNSLLMSCGLKIDIVKSTFPSLSRILFNNNDACNEAVPCGNAKCQLCKHELQTSLDHVTSTTTGSTYPINQNLSCSDGGIYVVTGACKSQYTGKTVDFSKRINDHFTTSTSVSQHKRSCHKCYITKDFDVALVEHYHHRGKFSLSEREYLWNACIKGTINIQKTLKAN